MIMLATMAFMISAVFRNSSLAIGLSIFLMFTGAELTGLLAMKFDWAKYVLFANTDLMQYFEGVPIGRGNDVNVLCDHDCHSTLYFFKVLPYVVFKKKRCRWLMSSF